MLRQYHAPRGRYVDGVCGLVGSIRVGQIVRLGRHQTVIVEGWLNREYHAGGGVVGNRHLPMHTKIIAGGHLAIVRNLKTGRCRTIADHHLRRALDDE